MHVCTEASDSTAFCEDRVIQMTASRPMAAPSASPPKASCTKNSAMSPELFVAPRYMELNSENTTIAVPSFSSDSPVITIVSFGDAPSSFSSATTATGSVAAQIEPNVMERFQSQPYGSTCRAASAVSTVPKSTPGTASSAHCESVRLSMCTFRFMASPKSSAGRKAKSIKCGSIASHWSMETPSAPSRPAKPLCRKESSMPSTMITAVNGSRATRPRRPCEGRRDMAWVVRAPSVIVKNGQSSAK